MSTESKISRKKSGKTSKKKKFPLMVSEDDLEYISYCKFASSKYKGGTSFLFKHDTFAFTHIIFKTIMKEMGYKYTKPEDFCWHNGEICDRIIESEYPWNH